MRKYGRRYFSLKVVFLKKMYLSVRKTRCKTAPFAELPNWKSMVAKINPMIITMPNWWERLRHWIRIRYLGLHRAATNHAVTPTKAPCVLQPRRFDRSCLEPSSAIKSQRWMEISLLSFVMDFLLCVKLWKMGFWGWF